MPGLCRHQRGEAILAEAQSGESPREPGTFLRSPLELSVLAALQSFFPLPATSIQVACLVEEASHRQVGTILKALAMLDVIEHWRRGYYRSRPVG